MVTQHEVDSLRAAFKEILKRVQIFEGYPSDRGNIAQIAAVAQGTIYDFGQIEGYDWRSIHVVVKVVDGRYAYIDPRPLSPHTEELVQKAMEPDDLAPQAVPN
jgi:hypothetical protein